jgi:SAM-dependent methyltransferase
MTDEGFAGRTFSAPQERCVRLSREILKYVDPKQPVRILDLGCGTGRQLFQLSSVLLSAELIGIDISESNIRVAKRDQSDFCPHPRLTFYSVDYMQFQAPPFDLIISDSTLHNINVPTDLLFSKVSTDLVPGGHLIATMPYDCFYNRALWTIRRLFRSIRCSVTDSLIFGISKFLHGRELGKDLLRERIHYMYLLPRHYSCHAVHRLLATDYGLELVHQHPVPHESIGQPKHTLLVFRKRPRL